MFVIYEARRILIHLAGSIITTIMSHTNNLRVTVFAHIRKSKTASSTPTFEEAFNQILSCQYWEEIELLRRQHITAKTYKGLIEKDTEGVHLSDYRTRHERAASKALSIKKNLPSFAWSGECTARTGGAFTHSGILCLDLDGKDNPDLLPRDMVERIKPLAYVLGWFVSPSGDGLKVLIRIKADESSHKVSFLVAEQAFAEVGLTVDPACKDVRRLCFVSSDQRAVLHPWKDTPELSIPDTVRGGGCYTEDTDNTEERVEGGGKVKPIAKPLSHTEREAASDAATKALKGKPDLKKLYDEYIGKKFSPEQGERNKHLIAMVTFLFLATGEERVMELAMAYYDVNQDIFDDSRLQHKTEAQSHLGATKERWFSELSDIENETISGMKTHQVEIFRICRDLQSLDKDAYPRGEFFISFADFERRINTPRTMVQRQLQRFEKRGIIKITKKGTTFQKGVKGGKATEYKWLLPYTLPPSKARSREPKETKVTATAKPRKRRKIHIRNPHKQNHPTPS